MSFKIGDRVKVTLNYSGEDHEHRYEILDIGEESPSRPDLGRPWTVRQLDSGEVFGMAHLEKRNPVLIGSDE